ncbi:MAG TPA: hypothetical protein VJG48_02805 [Candidatus Paceibacterota bacterium]
MKVFQVKRLDKRPVVYHGWRKVLYSWPVLVVLVLVVLFLFRATWRVYVVWGRSREASLGASAKYQKDLKRSQDLENEVSRLETERGLEEELRRNFPIVKPGEEVVVILGSKATSTR